MTIRIDRRQLLHTGLFGIGALASPAASRLLSAGGFTHGVASGEPGPDSVLLWTRFVSEGEPALAVEVAEDEEFGRVVASGEAVARNRRDFTARTTVAGLDPGRWYFYRFRAPDGDVSPVGRTRTLPRGAVERFRLGVFSCSNLRFGFFNAYGHAAARDDIDLAVHLGDYFYEYDIAHYPEPGQAVPRREIMPQTETVALADYWLRYASYRADPDLQALHARFPTIARWDDHEFANDVWEHGAENHQPEEGLWEVRKRAALQAYRDWMPVSDAPWESYEIGDLATIFLPETRIAGRMEPLSYLPLARGGGPLETALTEFRDGPWASEERTVLGSLQEAWLHRAIGTSAAAGKRWQVLAQQIVMGRLNFPLPFAEDIPADAPEVVRQRAGLLAAARRAGLPLNLDAWDGYPAARSRLLSSALEADANLVVLSGDSHNGWAFDLPEQGAPAGVEFAGHSVTSPGFESFLPGVDPARVAGALREASPDLKWADTSGRGYLTVVLTPDEVRGEWLFLDTVRTRSTAIARRQSVAAAHGVRRLSVA